MDKLADGAILDLLRPICAGLPGTIEKVTHGHPAFATSRGLYAVVEDYNGDLSLCVMVGFERQQILLLDPRFYRTPYIGNRGWVSLKLHAAPLDLRELTELVTLSHQITTAPKPKRQKKT